VTNDLVTGTTTVDGRVRVDTISGEGVILVTLAATQSPHNARSAEAAECTGEYRWDIKTLSDDQANEVDLHAVNAGVADFSKDKKPAGFKSSIRNPPLETTIYRVKANLRKAAG
jgi:hypothetical protein